MWIQENPVFITGNEFTTAYFEMYDRPCNWHNYFLAAIFQWKKYDVDFCFNYCFLLHSRAKNSLRLRTSKTQHMMWNLYFFLSQSHTLLRCVCNIYDSFDIFNFITSHTADVPKCLFLLHRKSSSYSMKSFLVH